MADTTPSHQGSAGSGRSWRSRHEELVLDAELRRLVRELYTIGPMPRSMLARSCHAYRWREGSFDEAVQEGIRRGVLARLPFDFIDFERDQGGNPWNNCSS
jgi:predicted AAA+ superfamily ATPase